MSPVELWQIFLASPGDVTRERTLVEQVVEEVNRTTAAAKGVVLRVVRWDKNTFPAYGKDAQAIVNDQIAAMEHFQLFVGIMWNRVGTKTPRAESGTIEEFERAVDARKRRRRPDIWFYFRTSAAKFDRRDQLEQRGKVLEFRQRVRRRGLPFEYESPAKFRDLFREHLVTWLQKRVAGTGTTKRRATTAPTPRQPTRLKPSLPAAATKAPTGAGTVAEKRSRSVRTQAPPKNRARPKQSGMVATSGSWVLLGESFFRATSVSHRSDGTIVLQIPAGDGEQSAALRALRPTAFRGTQQLPFAYQNEAGIVSVEAVESNSKAGKTVYTITVKPDERAGSRAGLLDVNVGNYTADDIAAIRARLMLLNEAPQAVPRQDLELILSFMSDGTRSSAKTGVFPELWSRLKGRRTHFVPQARLLAVYRLKTTQTVEDVLELRLGPIRNNVMPVRFRGRRRRRYDSEDPVVIQVVGKCSLT